VNLISNTQCTNICNGENSVQNFALSIIYSCFHPTMSKEFASRKSYNMLDASLPVFQGHSRNCGTSLPRAQTEVGRGEGELDATSAVIEKQRVFTRVKLKF
jgi:hypothetical protein